MVLHKFFPFKLQCVSNPKKIVHTHQYQDPSSSERYTIFSTKGLQDNKAARFFKSRITVLYCGKDSFNNQETRPVKRVHFDVEFPSISQSILQKTVSPASY